MAAPIKNGTRQEILLEAARAVCGECSLGNLPEWQGEFLRTMGAGLYRGWVHKNENGAVYVCHAAGIHDLLEKGK